MFCILPIIRRCFPVVFFAILLLLGLSSYALAESPTPKSQAPGYYRMMLGQFEVTALLDGFIDLDAALLKNITETESQDLLARAFIDDPHKLQTSVNAYLINTGSKLILVDAGSGNALGPTLGFLSRNLDASGYKPEQIDAVLITHLHSDHAGGLVDADGKPIFSKAVVYVSKAENDYWLSPAVPVNVPDRYKEYLKMARKSVQDTAAKYLASGRWKTFENSDLPISGIKAIPTPGHTPGHTAYEISSDGQSLIIIGDMVHVAAVQLTRPDAAVDFDADPKQAVSSREELFRHIADGKILMAGMHLSFPGIGRLRADGQNAYTFVPIDYSPMPAKQ